MKLQRRHVTAVLGPEAKIAYNIASGPTGEMFGGPTPTVPESVLVLPPNWRDVIRTVRAFATPYAEGRNDARACIKLDGKAARAGGPEGMIEVAFPCGGIPLPVLLPVEIAWEEIPGTDGAVIWPTPKGYVLRADSGVRVHAARDTTSIEPYPWHRFFEDMPADYQWAEIVEPLSWLKALESAPSKTVILEFGREDAWVRENREDLVDPWSRSAVSLPAILVGPPRSVGYCLDAQALARALRAAIGGAEDGDSVVIAFRGEPDPVWVGAGTVSVILPTCVPEPDSDSVPAMSVAPSKSGPAPKGKGGAGSGSGKSTRAPKSVRKVG